MESDGPAWVADAVFYQIFPDRFARSASAPQVGPLEAWDAPPTVLGFKGGDLRGVVEHLDHLAGLGVTAIYLNPVFASAANHRYHTYDYLRVDPLLGGNAALRELLDAAHDRGMRVILDGVFNHVGRGFWAFHHVLEAGAQSPYRDWFHLDRDRLDAGRRLEAYPPEVLPDRADAGWADAHRSSGGSLGRLGYRAWWDLPALPELNVENPRVREHLLSVAEHWIRFGADGWRLDVAEELAPSFWRELRDRVRTVNPEAYLVGEIWHPAAEWIAPAGPFDGVMNYPLAWAISGFAAGHRLDREAAATQAEMRDHLRPLDGPAFVAALRSALEAYPPEARTQQLNLLGSHDTPRLRTVCGGDLRSVELAMLLLFAMPGAPCLYYGDEIGLAGGADPGCRAAFPWERERWASDLPELVRRASACRAALTALRGPRVEAIASAAGAVVLYRDGVEPCWVAVNAGDVTATLELPRGAPVPPSAAPRLLVGDALHVAAGPGGTTLRIPPRSGAILGAG